MRGVLLVVKNFRTRLLFGEPRPLCAYSMVASATDQSISKIYTKVSETKSLLATIIVREGVLLVHNRDFFSIRAMQVEISDTLGVWS